MHPALDSYIGLSGVLNAIWVGGALVCARKTRGTLGTAYIGCVLAGLVKIAVEGFGGVAIFTNPISLGGVPVPLAHALGCLGGWMSVARFQPGRVGSRLAPLRARSSDSRPAAVA